MELNFIPEVYTVTKTFTNASEEISITRRFFDEQKARAWADRDSEYIGRRANWELSTGVHLPNAALRCVSFEAAPTTSL